jgi:Calpain family cysteine protease
MVGHAEQSDKTDKVNPNVTSEKQALSAGQHNPQGNAIVSAGDAKKQNNPAMDHFPSADSLLSMFHSGSEKTKDDSKNKAQAPHADSSNDGKKAPASAADSKAKPTSPAENNAPVTDINQFIGIGKAILKKINPDGSPVTESELDKAMDNPSYKGQDAQVMTAMYATYGFLKSANGITAADLEKIPQVEADRKAFIKSVASLTDWAHSNLAKFAGQGENGLVNQADINKALANPDVSSTDKSNLRELNGLFKTVTGLSGYPNIEADDLQRYATEYASPNTESSLSFDLNGAVTEVSDIEKIKYNSSLYATNNPLDSIKSDAILQGRSGDCFLEASLAAVAQSDPQSIENAIKDNKNGTYTVTFPGAKQYPVTVSAPSMNELALFNGAGKDGTWASVMEKAYGELTKEQPQLMASLRLQADPEAAEVAIAHVDNAKPRDPGNPVSAYQGGDMLKAMQLGLLPTSQDAPLPQAYVDGGGIPADAMDLLTGNKISSTDWATFRGNSAKIAQQLEKAFSAGTPPAVTAGTPDIGLPSTIVPDHSYSVMGFKPDGHGGGTVTLRNPWGFNSDSDPKAEMNLPLSAFMKDYNSLYVEQR